MPTSTFCVGKCVYFIHTDGQVRQLLITHGHDCSVWRLSSIGVQDLVQPIEVDCSLVICGLLRVDVKEDPLKQPEKKEKSISQTAPKQFRCISHDYREIRTKCVSSGM